ncbi:SWIM-type domain-containing protein, partial [Aphis craccivora]
VDAEHAYLKLIGENLDYPNWINYIQNYWSYRQKWCLCFRDHTSRGHVTNNYLRLLLREFSDSRNALSRLFLRKMIKKATYLKKEMIIQESGGEFLVPSEEESGLMYYVDINSGICSCSAALTGKFCKHQCAVYKYFGVKSEYCPVITPTDRLNIAKIAYGDKVIDESFYEPFLKENNGPINNIEIKSIENNILCNENVDTEENRLLTSRIENNDNENKKIIGILKLEERLKKIKTEGQWETFLHTAGQQVALRRRDIVMIKVQPTSIARRSAKVTKGSKRLLAGRPVDLQ